MDYDTESYSLEQNIEYVATKDEKARNQIIFSDEQMEEFCKECRQVLIREKKNTRHLIKRQQIAAWLIIYAPWLHKIIYRIYKRRR